MQSYQHHDAKELKLDAPIPKTIHYIWVGGPIKEKYLRNILRMAEIAKKSGFQIHVWVDHEKNIDKTFEKMTSGSLPFKALQSSLKIRNINELLPSMEQDAFLKNERRIDQLKSFINREMIGFKNLASAADLLRYIILYLEGGYYLDTDIELTHPRTEKNALHEEKFTLGFKANIRTTWHRGFLKDANFSGNNDIIASLPHHPILQKTIQFSLENYTYLDRTFHNKNQTTMDLKRWPNSPLKRELTINVAAGPLSLVEGVKDFWQEYTANKEELADIDSADKSYKTREKVVFSECYELITSLTNEDFYAHRMDVAGINMTEKCDTTWLVETQKFFRNNISKSVAFDTTHARAFFQYNQNVELQAETKEPTRSHAFAADKYKK